MKRAERHQHHPRRVISCDMTHLLGEAIGIGAGVAALQVNLMRPHAVELHEASGIEFDAAVGTHVHFANQPLTPSG